MTAAPETWGQNLVSAPPPPLTGTYPPLHKHAESQENKGQKGPVLRQASACTRRVVPEECMWRTPWLRFISKRTELGCSCTQNVGVSKRDYHKHDVAPFSLYNRSTTASHYISDLKNCGEKKPGKQKSDGVSRREGGVPSQPLERTICRGTNFRLSALCKQDVCRARTGCDLKRGPRLPMPRVLWAGLFRAPVATQAATAIWGHENWPLIDSVGHAILQLLSWWQQIPDCSWCVRGGGGVVLRGDRYRTSKKTEN